ncbi:sensor histidine kinase [Ekhidna sp.]|uniref:sensor histidine kinase n=1 Tax=Ekhidna sp. TaxID=2608089 RepID=UPI003BAC3050
MDKLFLKFPEPLEKRYMINRMDQDIYGFKLMFGSLLLINPFLIFLDIARFDDPYSSIGVRFSLEVILIFIFIASHRIKGGQIVRYQSLFFFSTLIVYSFLLAMDYLLKDEFYYLFIPNVTTITIILNASFIGLRFRHSTLTNLLILIIYSIYSLFLTSQEVHSSQIVYLSIFYIIATILSYLFERNNRELFLNNQIIEEKTGIIQEKNEVLKQENELKDSLMSILTHDVKGPLTTLESLLKLREKHLISEKDILNHFDKVSHSVNTIRKFTERTILWIKSQMDGFKVKKQSVKIYPLVEAIIDLINDQAAKKNIKFDNKVEKGFILETDPEILEIVIRNLLMNAVKFSEEFSNVIIEVSKTFNELRLHVKDYGVGISDSKKASIFSLDELVTKGTKKERGTGLGLSLCYNLMKKLDGRLTFTSKEGEGSTFTIIFPIDGK